ncbi:TlpA family protein disulfide reductase [Halopenitus sp. H-Gu1]|uniref:TlpA family protein disulfide reductase n=1 Tax=Halopenitus sp. H-Gu1 TaxID=3242697 RepID=UPI00359E0C23
MPMRRREVLIGGASLFVAGGGALVATGAGRDDATSIEPVEIETLDAPGSESGTTFVPEPGRVTYLEVFATWCSVCRSMMPRIASVHGTFGEEIQFASVTNEPIGNTTARADVVDWWDRNDGAWTVGIDDELVLTERLDASGVPYSFVIDAENRITWSHRGAIEASTIEARIRDARR